MILTYLGQKNPKPTIITASNQSLMHDASWIDLLNPTKEEEILVEKVFELDLPTREEMQEIEISSRLYKDSDAIFMTVMMIAESDSPQPKCDPVTFVLKNDKLITVRYIQPQTFALFIARLPTLTSDNHNAVQLVIELLDISIDRLADILEKVSYRLDNYSQTIFNRKSHDKSVATLSFKQCLQDIGSSGDLNTKIQESLITFNRLISFFVQNCTSKLNADMQLKINLLTKDITSLNDNIFFLSNKVNFLLDATLGMISIEQNDIIKIFSIVAVILLPPTLIASIYGMNFHNMPELSWHFGYPYALILMILSAWLPFRYFKRKRWL